MRHLPAAKRPRRLDERSYVFESALTHEEHLQAKKEILGKMVAAKKQVRTRAAGRLSCVCIAQTMGHCR